MAKVIDRFFRYIAIDTQSSEEIDQIPSSPGQWKLAELLADELREMGVSNVRMDSEHAYVYGEIPSNTEGAGSLGFISHMDTAPGTPGDASRARIVPDYDGEAIPLNEDVKLDPEDFPELLGYVGQDLIVTDGVSLLGGDDKAGVSEIMTMAETLLADPAIPHGKIGIAFTPDEETGRGTDFFDVPGFGVDYAYTVDGGAIGELEYENFNAAAANLTIRGKNIHPGSAKDVMVNALRIAMEFDAMLPEDQRPEHTENYEGFFHLMDLKGDTGLCTMSYIIRDHDASLFAHKKTLMESAAAFLNKKYPGAVTLEIRDSYRNMKEKIEPHMFLIEQAEEAFRACGVQPKVVPIRGGTDGAMLSYKGLPCPNLSTGGHNFHSNTEYIPVQSMEKMVQVLVELAKGTASK